MTDEVYEHLLSIENEYKSVNNCPDSDPRLKWIHNWWLTHPDIRKSKVFEIYRDGEYLMTGTAKEIAKEIGFSGATTVYNFDSEIYKMRKHYIYYEIVEIK